MKPDLHHPSGKLILVDVGQGPLKVREEFINGLLDGAQRVGWQLLNIAFGAGEIPAHAQLVGAIMKSFPGDPVAAKILSLKCPVVRIGYDPHPLDDQVPAILHNLQTAGRLAAAHFAERHFKHVGFIGRTPWGIRGKPLYDSFCGHALELGIACHLLQLENDWELSDKARFKKRQQVVGKWLSTIPKPIGLFCAGDFAAGKLCTWSINNGFAIPEDIAVLGIGNHTLACKSALVPLSSLDLNDREYGREVIRLLHRLVNGEPAPKEPVLFPPKGVVTRRSTDILAVPDPRLARAMRFIWDHYSEPLSVNDIAAQTGMSRSTLNRVFKQHLNRGPNAELLRIRLEHCRELLTGTRMSIEQISARTGFSSPNYLHESFRKAFGTTPGAYRRKGRPVKN